MKALRIYESPDEISWPDLRYNKHGEAIDNNEWSPAFGDKNSYPFWYENGEFVLGREYSGHPTAIERNDSGSFSGRVWADRKLISFWVYPSEFEFKDIAAELSERLSKKGYNADILNDPEWKVEILTFGTWRDHMENFQTKLVSASDYKGSGKRSSEDLGQNHYKSPLDPTKKSPSYIKKKHKDIRMRYAMGENRFVPESLEELFEFERGVDPKRSMGIGVEATKAKIKEEIAWRIGDTRYHGPNMLKFDVDLLSEKWERGTEVEKMAIKELMEEWLSGMKKWRTRNAIYNLKETLYDSGLLFDPKYMLLTPSTWETIAWQYPKESKEFALQYFKPNQIYSIGVNYSDAEMMKEGIKRGATNLGIGGSQVFEIPLKNDDGELLQSLLDKSPHSPEEIFGAPPSVARYQKPWMSGNERDESNRALRSAARDGKINTFKVLFNDRRSDPSATNNFALKWAIKGGYWDIVDILLTDERVREKINLLPKNTIKQLKESPYFKDDYGLFESINFERGKDPRETMGVGKHSEDLKVHRCGYCGAPTDEEGHEIPYDSEEFRRVTEIIEDMDDQTTELNTCDSCHYGMEMENREAEARAEAELAWQEEQWRNENGY